MTIDQWRLPAPRTLRELSDVSKQTLASVRYVLAFLGKADRGTARLLAALTVLSGSFTIAAPYVAMRLVEAVIAAQQVGHIAPPLMWLAIEASLVMAGAIVANVISHRSAPLEAKGQLYLASEVLSKACRVPYANFEKQEFVDRLTRAKDSTGQAVAYVFDVFAILRSSVVLTGCLFLLLSAWVWVLPLITLLALPPHLVRVAFARQRFGIEEQNARHSRQRWYLEWLITSESTAKELRAFQAGDWMVSLYRKACSPAVAAKLALAKRFRAYELACDALGIVARYGPYAFVVVQAVRGYLSLGELLLFTMAFPACSAALNALLGAFTGLLANGLHVRFVREFLEQGECTDGLSADEPLLPAAPELVIEDLWFTYPGADSPVLRGLNLRIRAGETLAIVGANGAGKTTLIKLLLGLYPIQRGRILLGGVDVSQRSASWRQRNIGVVFQDFGRFQFSVLDNVAIGGAEDSEDEALVWRALEKAGAEHVVRGLSNGVHTALGPAFGGHDLSGGQWQRIALARLFMRRSRLWILDEPSAAMDPEGEARTFQRFSEWAAGRTSLIISHRLSTVLLADRIAVIHAGQVAQVGSHRELVASGGRYAQLFPPLGRTREDELRGVAM